MTTKLSAVFLILASAAAAQVTPVYPGQVASNQQLMVAANNLETSLTANITSSAVFVPVANTTGFVPWMLITFSDTPEIAVVCSVPSIGVLQIGFRGCPNTAGRGFDNSVATPHIQGALIKLFFDAWHRNADAAEIIALETLLGANGANIPSLGGGGMGVLVSNTFTGPAEIAYVHNLGVANPPFNCVDHTTKLGVVLGENVTTPGTTSATYLTAGVAGTFDCFFVSGGGQQGPPGTPGTIVPPLTVSGSFAQPIITATNTGTGLAAMFSSILSGVSVNTSGNGNALTVSMGGTAGHAGAFSQTTSIGTATVLINNLGSDPALQINVGSLIANGGVGGTHLQALGSGDSPSFVNLTIANNILMAPITGSIISPIFNANVAGYTGNTFQNSDGSYQVTYQGIVEGQQGFFTNTAISSGIAVRAVCGQSSPTLVCGSAVSAINASPRGSAGPNVYAYTGLTTGNNSINASDANGSCIGGAGVGGFLCSFAGTPIGPSVSPLKTQTFSALPSCSAAYFGSTAAVSDSSSNTWGGAISGSGAFPVLAFCNGVNWTVAAK